MPVQEHVLPELHVRLCPGELHGPRARLRGGISVRELRMCVFYLLLCFYDESQPVLFVTSRRRGGDDHSRPYDFHGQA